MEGTRGGEVDIISLYSRFADVTKPVLEKAPPVEGGGDRKNKNVFTITQDYVSMTAELQQKHEVKIAAMENTQREEIVTLEKALW